MYSIATSKQHIYLEQHWLPLFGCLRSHINTNIQRHNTHTHTHTRTHTHTHMETYIVRRQRDEESAQLNVKRRGTTDETRRHHQQAQRHFSLPLSLPGLNENGTMGN